MTRQPNTDKSGNAWTEQTKKLIWDKGTTIEGYFANIYRKDKCGHILHWMDYGNRQSDFGWEIDHINPVAKGGDDNFNNLQPLYWKYNLEKGDSITWHCPHFGL